MIRKFIFYMVLMLLISMHSVSSAGNDCRSSFINPFTDVRWDAVFPVEIAGVKIKGPADLDDPIQFTALYVPVREEVMLQWDLQFLTGSPQEL